MTPTVNFMNVFNEIIFDRTNEGMLVPGNIQQSQARSTTDIRLDEVHQEWQVQPQPQPHMRPPNEEPLYHPQISGEGIQIVVDEPIDSGIPKTGEI